MLKTALSIGLLLLLAVPVFAQGPFADVPPDHWAYEAVNELQEDGILIGYPDGTFRGNRAITRYEFAVAIARMVPVLEQRILEQVADMLEDIDVTPGGVGEERFNQLQNSVGQLENRVTALEQRGPGGVTLEQFNALQALVNEFRDEIAALGVDVDALRRDLAGLAARVEVLEKEQQRVRFWADLNTFAVATSVDDGTPFDLAGRPFQGEGAASGELINSVSFVNDMDLWVRGTLTPSVSVVADLNFGNFIPAYLGGVVNDFIGTERTTQTRTPGEEFSSTYSFVPYYMFAEWGFGNGSLQVGRIPVQYTPYTLKMIDVAPYIYDETLDMGNYPLDGGKLTWRLGAFDILAFATKTDQNELLFGPNGVGGGLVGQPTIALYDNFAPTPTVGGAPFHDAGGHAAGGLLSTTQAAGARVTFGTPFRGTLGLTYINAAGPIDAGYDETEVFGADGRWQFGRFGLAASYTVNDTSDDDEGLADIDDDNTALDVALTFGLGKLGVDLGWRSIEHNFAAPGYWTKVGMWANPTNIEGPYLNLNYGLTSSVSLVANAAFYEGANTVAGLPLVIDETDDELWNAEIGLRWGLSSTNSLSLGWERVRWSPDGGDDTDEDYISIGWAYQINPSAGFNLSYQIVDYSPSGAIAPYGTAEYKGAIAVAQLKAKF